MASLEDNISLALAAKLKLIFEKSPEKFLCFPTGIAYPFSFFSFMEDPAASGLSAQQHLNYKVEFARLTGFVPQDRSDFLPDMSNLLWDRYKTALNEATFASSTLNSEENRRLDEAIDFLTDTQDGITINSPALNQYLVYKTAYDEIDRQYQDEKITVESTTGPEGEALRQQWTASRERIWLDKRNRAMEDWVNLGNKNQVENYQAIRKVLEPRRFGGDQLRVAYLNDLTYSELEDTITPGLVLGHATVFSPSNVFEENVSWQSLSLTKAEINTLAAQAPAELSSRYGGGQAGADIEKLSFEYNRIVIVRPWFKPEFLTYRGWTLRQGAMLSDGKVPASGTLPAYISSIIGVRNMVVTRRKGTSPTVPLIIPIISRERVSTEYKVNKNVVPVESTTVFNPRLAESVRVVSTTPDTFVASEAATMQPVMMRSAATARIGKAADSSVSRFTPVTETIQPQTLEMYTKAVTPEARTEYVTRKYTGTTIKKTNIDWSDIRATTTTNDTSEPAPELTEERISFDGVIVIAYECTRLPLCPNPDPSLQW